MDNNYQDKLEKLIHSELQKLPPLSAPAGLISSTLALIKHRANRPWWQQPFLVWHPKARLLLFILLTALLAGAALGVRWLAQLTGFYSLPERLVESIQSLSPFWEFGVALVNATGSILRSIGTTWLIAGLSLGAFVYLSCIGLGVTCYRLVKQNFPG